MPVDASVEVGALSRAVTAEVTRLQSLVAPAGDQITVPDRIMPLQMIAPADEAWVSGTAGLWRRTSEPGVFHVLPQEYRLAFDRESRLPAMTVLLINPPADRPGDDYRARVRFELVPWFDPVRTAALRVEIAESTGTVFPELVVGGYDSAEFAASALFDGLGGTVLGAGASPTGVDGRGFELVLECDRQYYTLLTHDLAPGDGAVAKMKGQVRFGLVGPRGQDVHAVDVDIRLDQPSDDFLVVEQIPPLPGSSGRRPPLYARVRNLAGGAADVEGSVAVLLVGKGPTPGKVVRALVEPGTFRVGEHGSEPPPPPPPGPPPPPAFPPGQQVFAPNSDHPAVRTFQLRMVELGYMQASHANGRFTRYTREMTKRLQADYGLSPTGELGENTWEAAFPPPAPPPPAAGSGEVVLALRPERAIDLRDVSAVVLEPTGVVLHVARPAVLVEIHKRAAGAVDDTSVRVRSYQLAHPEHLGPALADVYGLEVQIRLDGREPVTAFLSRDEPDKTVALSLRVGDLIGGLDPQQPTFEWRRRNLVPSGTGEFSPWASVTGRELLVVPVLPEA